MQGLALLIPGGTGQLGSDLAAAAPDGLVRAMGSAELDITDVGAVLGAVTGFAELAREERLRPVVINAAAFTAVDDAEDAEDMAFTVNSDGPRVLAAACSSHRLPLVQVSTDYVFDGEARSPYRPDDVARPTTAYGRTKLVGEDAVLRSGARAWVVRTSWVYGAVGSNFVKTMVQLERDRDELSVVDDQRGAPTWSADLAAGLLELADRVTGENPPTERVLHCSGAGETTWCRFAKAIFEELGADPDRVHACTTEEFPRPAPRPAYSVLSGDSWRKAGLTPLRPWREALSAFFARHRGEL
ncbi:MAG: dTDP-4-dehydrorhamnose reductase [Pseudonocardiaceae bacterium]|nr:dTDP-4-dehydrorhamnose reductase [Pseudonocardiaceae bacterium]